MAEASAASPTTAAPSAEAASGLIDLPGMLPDSGDASRFETRDELVRAPLALDDEETSDVPEEDQRHGDRKAEKPKDDVETLSREELAQKYKTLQGMHKALAAQGERGKQAEQRFIQANEVAAAWKAKAEQFEALIAQMTAQVRDGKPGGQPSAKPAEAQAEATSVAALFEEAEKAIDQDIYDKIAEIHGERTAQAWERREVLKLVEARMTKLAESLEAKSKELFRPVEEAEKAQAVVDAGRELFRDAAALQDEDGDPLFPELRDAAAEREIAKLWATQGLSEESFSIDALHRVIALYRDVQRWREKQSARRTVQPARDESPGVSSPDLDATTSSPMRVARALSEADRIRAQFRETGADRHVKAFGFAR